MPHSGTRGGKHDSAVCRLNWIPTNNVSAMMKWSVLEMRSSTSYRCRRVDISVQFARVRLWAVQRELGGFRNDFTN